MHRFLPCFLAVCLSIAASQAAAEIRWPSLLGEAGERAPRAAAAQVDVSHHSFRHEDRTRSYRLVRPRARAQQAPTPVIMAFHGGGGTARSFAAMSGLDRLAARRGAVVVYPEGVRRFGVQTWNGGGCCGPAMRAGVDDAGFAAALLDRLERTHGITPGPVAGTGFSNGSIAIYEIAARRPALFDAIIPVSGASMTSVVPRGPVPVLHIHGTQDAQAPYDGGRGEGSRLRRGFTSVASTLRTWTTVNACGSRPRVSALPDRDGDDQAPRYLRWTGCDAPVAHLRMTGMGHVWPGGTPPRRLGDANRDLSATAWVWRFLMANA